MAAEACLWWWGWGAGAAAGACTVAAALLLDHAAGDPPNRLHPTAWAGRLAGAAVPRLIGAGGRRPRRQRAAGAVLVAGMAALVAGLAWAAEAALGSAAAAAWLSPLPLPCAPGAEWQAAALAIALPAVAAAVLLKTTISVRGMERHALAVAGRLDAGDLAGARASLAMIVKRDTSRLDGAHVASAAVESVSENTVDGVTGPLFYFGLFGLAGAFAHRTVSTLDSMVGYRTWLFRDLGWFAARCDTVLNYAPARLTALCMVAAAALVPRADWRAAYRAAARDASAPDSRNSGFPMAAMAGALGARLEKEGSYCLGAGLSQARQAPPASASAAASAAPALAPLPDAALIRSSVSIMRAACAVFACAVTVPSAAAVSWAWWLALG